MLSVELLMTPFNQLRKAKVERPAVAHCNACSVLSLSSCLLTPGSGALLDSLGCIPAAHL